MNAPLPPHMQRRAVVFAAAAAAVAAALAAAPRVVHAHARLVKADPSPRSTIATAPATIRLWFSERIEPAFAVVSIVDARGQSTPLRPVTAGADDPKRVEAPAPPLQPGTYRVRYRVVSVDGHVIEADFAFTLKGDR